VEKLVHQLQNIVIAIHITLQVTCHQYWPSHGHVVYGGQKVTLKAVEGFAEYTIRVFNLETVMCSLTSGV